MLNRAFGEKIVCSTAGHAVEVPGHEHWDVSAGCNLLQALEQSVHLHSTKEHLQQYYENDNLVI